MSIQNPETEALNNQITNDTHRDKRSKLNPSSQDEENFSCIICSETWKSKGAHCLVSLKCGHLFGKKCITRWIHDRAKKYGTKKGGCPICTKVSSKGDIRLIKPARFAVKDTTHMDLLKKELDALKYSIKDQEKTLELSHLSLNLHKRQFEKKKQEIQRVASITSMRSSNITSTSSASDTTSQITSDTPALTSSNTSQATSNPPTRISSNSTTLITSNTLTQIISNTPTQIISNTPTQAPSNTSTQVSSSAPTESTIRKSQISCNAPAQIINNPPLPMTSNAPSQIASNSTIEVNPTRNIPIRYSISKSKKLSDSRHTCRVMTIDPTSNTAYISYKQSNQHGVIALDLLDMNQSPILPIHDNLVRDVKFSDGYLLSTSNDKTLRLTSTKTYQTGISIPLKVPGWSCCFNEFNTNKIYCGLADSSVVVYDIRNTRMYEQLYCSQTLSKTPIHSMFVKSDKHTPRIYCSNVIETFIWDSNHTVKKLDKLQGYKPYSLSHHSNDIVLLSSRNESSTKHQFINIGANLNSTILCTLTSTLAQKSLTRTFSFGNAGNSIICYSQEEQGSLCLSTCNQEIQHFSIGSCPLDIQLYNENLAFLTDNRLFLLAAT